MCDARCVIGNPANRHATSHQAPLLTVRLPTQFDDPSPPPVWGSVWCGLTSDFIDRFRDSSLPRFDRSNDAGTHTHTNTLYPAAKPIGRPFSNQPIDRASDRRGRECYCVVYGRRRDYWILFWIRLAAGIIISGRRGRLFIHSDDRFVRSTVMRARHQAP